MRSAALAAALALSACTPQADAPVDAPSLPAFDTAVATTVLLPRERVWDGVVEAVHQATLSAQTAGRVVELPFDVNDYVAAGEVVVRFTDVEQQSARRSAQAALESAQAAAREAEADHARIADIHARGLVARAQLDQATARRDAARAALDAAHAGLREAEQQLDYTIIRAPYAGILTERHVEIGESVRPGQALVSGLSLERLRVHVEVPQSEVAALRGTPRAAVLLDDGRRVEAARVTVFPYADPATHSFSVRLELPDVDTGLHPGMTAKVAFILGEDERLAVPYEAIVRRSEITGVYVVDGDRLTLRQLRVGHRYGDAVAVLAGLSAGERFVRDPVQASQWLAQRPGDD